MGELILLSTNDAKNYFLGAEVMLGIMQILFLSELILLN